VEDDDALIFYKKIAALAQKIFWTMANLFEINQYLERHTMLCLKIKFQNIELRKDYGNEG
jgi:release factor glutamine methyltransferase